MTAKSRSGLASDIATVLDNTAGAVTPAIIRTVLQDIVDSAEIDQVSGVATVGQYLVGQASGPPAWQSLSGANARPALTGNATYYVRTDGNDSNTGLTDSSGGAWATWQHAANFASTIDLNGQILTLQHGNEGGPKTFATGMTIGTLTGGGQLIISGSPTAGWTNFATSADCISAYDTCSGTVEVQQMTLASSAANAIQASYRTVIILGAGVVFGSCPSGTHMYAHDNQASILALGQSYKLTAGSMASHATAVNGGHIYIENCTVTLTGAITFSSFVQAQENGVVQSGSGTTWNVSGATITGAKFAANMGGTINSLGDGISFFPGSAPGQTSQGGNHDGIDNSAWTTASVAPTPLTGSFTATGSVEYTLPGGTKSKTAHVKITVVVTNTGSGGGGLILVPLPAGMTSASGSVASFVGRDATSGAALLGELQPSGNTVTFTTMTGSTPINVSTGMHLSGTIHLA